MNRPCDPSARGIRSPVCLFLLPELFLRKGGIAVYNADLIRAFTLRFPEKKAYVLTLNDEAVPLDHGLGRNVDVTSCGAIRSIRKPLFVIRSLVIAARTRPETIVCGHVNFSALCLLINMLVGIPYRICAYGFEVWEAPGVFRRWALRQSSMIIAISRFTRDRMVHHVPDLRGKMVLLANAVDGDRFLPGPKSGSMARRFGLDGAKVLLTVARLKGEERYKGYDRVIRLMPKLLASDPSIRYLIVGGGDDLPRVRKLVSELRLEREVIFAGFIPDGELPAVYGLCDLFVMPSKMEGFGFVFLEALASGKPVVAGGVDGSRDPLLDGELGILVDPDNDEEILDAIRKGLAGKEGVPRGEFARNKVLEHFGFRRFCERVGEIFG